MWQLRALQTLLPGQSLADFSPRPCRCIAAQGLSVGHVSYGSFWQIPVWFSGDFGEGCLGASGHEKDRKQGADGSETCHVCRGRCRVREAPCLCGRMCTAKHVKSTSAQPILKAEVLLVIRRSICSSISSAEVGQKGRKFRVAAVGSSPELMSRLTSYFGLARSKSRGAPVLTRHHAGPQRNGSNNREGLPAVPEPDLFSPCGPPAARILPNLSTRSFFCFSCFSCWQRRLRPDRRKCVRWPRWLTLAWKTYATSTACHLTEVITLKQVGKLGPQSGMCEDDVAMQDLFDIDCYGPHRKAKASVLEALDHTKSTVKASISIAALASSGQAMLLGVSRWGPQLVVFDADARRP
eukprot:s678_g9.t3